MIRDFDNINHTLLTKNIDVLVVSFGGSGSNNLTDILEQNGYKCRTTDWVDILCHCPNPLNVNIPIIYVYRNIVDAFFSIKRRGYWAINQKKLTNNKNTILSDRNLFESMRNQFLSWKNSNMSNLLFVHYDECFDMPIKKKLGDFLKNNNLINIPSVYVKPNTQYDLKEVDPRLLKIFDENRDIIEQTNCIF